MSTFDRIDIVAEGQFSLTELESTGERGTFELELPIERGTTAVAVIMEGQRADALIEVNGESVAAEGGSDGVQGGAPPRRSWLRVSDNLKSLRVRIATEGERVKISILRVLRDFGADFRKRLSCTG